MSESLKALMHRQATSVDFKPSDLESIVHTSHGRVRRRRALATLATVVAVALAGGGVAAVLGNRTDGPPSPPLPAGPWPLDAVSWAVGSTIHVGATDTIEVGHEVYAYVRTVTGFVVLDETDAVYSVTESGVTQIGQVNDTLPDNTDVQRLVVNSTGTRVGWVDESALSDSLAVRIYDPLYGSTRDIPAPRTTPDVHALPGVLLFAIDDRTAYWRTYEGVHEFDLDSGSDRLIVAREDVNPGDAIYSYEVYSATNGVLAFTPEDDRRIFAGRSVEDAIEVLDFSKYESQIQIPEELKAQGAEIIEGHTDPVRLSPTGAWLSFGIFEAIALPVGDPREGDAEVTDQQASPVVFDTTTGDRVTLAIPDTMLGMPSVWLDDTTLQVVAFTVDKQQAHMPTSATMFVCSVPDGKCRPAAQLELPIPALGAFPDGRWYGQR